MKHLKFFETDGQYETFKSSEDFVLPNVSYVSEFNSIYYNPYVEANLCDIAYWDGSKVKTISHDKWNSNLGTPVGVVVIPSGFAPDGKARIVALEDARKYNENGEPITRYVCFLRNDPIENEFKDIVGLTNYTSRPITDNVGYTADSINTTASSKRSCLPSDDDSFEGSTSFVDPSVKYSTYYGENLDMIPSPYVTKDGKYEPNDEYYKVIDGNNVMSDFKGIHNTEILLNEPQTDTEFYEAAYVAHHYVGGVTAPYVPTECGVKWYLPAAGEFGYAIVRRKNINEIISKINGEVIPINAYWTSNENSISHAYCMFTTHGLTEETYKDAEMFVRPFAIIP